MMLSLILLFYYFSGSTCSAPFDVMTDFSCERTMGFACMVCERRVSSCSGNGFIFHPLRQVIHDLYFWFQHHVSGNFENFEFINNRVIDLEFDGVEALEKKFL